jgi:hypothetical protein
MPSIIYNWLILGEGITGTGVGLTTVGLGGTTVGGRFSHPNVDMICVNTADSAA